MVVRLQQLCRVGTLYRIISLASNIDIEAYHWLDLTKHYMYSANQITSNIACTVSTHQNAAGLVLLIILDC